MQNNVSGQGKCGVAVIRVSGNGANKAVLCMTRRTTLPEPRTAVLTAIKHPTTDEPIDRGLLLWFPAPKSFTGEDCCELQVHGGSAVVSAVLSALSTLPSFRPAEPGEFTKRAFMAGRMDLTQVEGLADLIHAETQQQRRQALLQMEGSLAKLYGQWRTTLIKCVAHVEAYIDFSEEELIEQDVLKTTRDLLKNLVNQVESHLQDGRRGEILKNGVRTAILGEPNVGKSSLLNFLVGRAAAIVTPIAGTTRDVVEVPINVAGFPMVLADTAGQRQDAHDVIEMEGMRRAQLWTTSADLVLVVMDANQVLKSNDWLNYLSNHRKKLNLKDEMPTLIVINKIDLLSAKEKEILKTETTDDRCRAVCISCTTEEGLDRMVKEISDKLKLLCGNPSRETPSLTQARHRHHLTQCAHDIRQGLSLCSEQSAPLAAHQLRKALKQLGQVTGHVTTDQILDVIFKDFCVGK